MKLISRLPTVAAVFVVVSLGHFANGSEVPGNAPQRVTSKASVGGSGDATEWTRIFNGKNLDGWVVKCRPGDKDKIGYWKVVDGTITAETPPGSKHHYIWLLTKKEYGDFALKLKVQTYASTTGNSGVQVRSRYDDEAGWLDGPQVDINPPGAWRCGFIYDETRGAQVWLWPDVGRPANAKPQHAPEGWKWFHADDQDVWNDVQIVCRGARIRTVINGVTIADYDGAGRLDDAAHRNRNVGMKGHIGLQIHPGKQLLIRFKDIEISSPLVSGAERGGLAASLDDDGMLVVGGERRFVFGCYWNPGTEEGLAQLRAAGFNLVMSKAERAALDQVARHDLLAWIPLGGNISPATEADDKRLEVLVRPLLDHPALAVWEVPDEALWNVWYGRQQRLAEERKKLRAMRDEQEKASRDTGRVSRLMKEADAARSRADWTVAEALDRQIRKLLGAPPQNSDLQMSAAPQAAELLRQRLLRGYRLLHQLDGRPVWMNYAPRNTLRDLQRYAAAADIVGCDIYPAPARHTPGHSDLVNRQLTSVADYTDRFRSAGGRRPVWMVLQGFGWRDIQVHAEDAPQEKGRRPTRDESRLMLYSAIVHGSRGVLYWGSQYAQDPPDFWDDLRSVVREAAELQHVWAARDAETQPKAVYLPTHGSVDRPPRALAKQLKDQQYILVVNEHYEGLGVRLEGLEGLNGSQASLCGDADGCQLKTDQVQKGSLIVHMPGLSATVVVLKLKY